MALTTSVRNSNARFTVNRFGMSSFVSLNNLFMLGYLDPQHKVSYLHCIIILFTKYCRVLFGYVLE
jgi:hypothetical protein